MPAEPVFLAQRTWRDRMAVEGIDARVAARQVQSIGQRIVEIEHAQPYDLPGRQIQQRSMSAIDRRQHPGVPAGRTLRGTLNSVKAPRLSMCQLFRLSVRS